MRAIDILIVDDSEDDRFLYSRLLAASVDLRCRVSTADSGARGLAECRVHPPDCVVLDYQLPDMSGVDFLQQLRASEQLGECAVVMVTGHASEVIACQAIKQGAEDYLVKEAITGPVLERAVQNALEKATLRRERDERYREVKRSNRELELYAHVVSHDLRAPLNQVRGYGELLNDGYGHLLPTEARDLLARLLEATELMEELLKELLIYSKVGMHEPLNENVDLGRLLAEVLEGLSMTLARAGVRVEMSTLPTVKGNRLRLRQLLQNLLTNAVKLRGTSPPQLRVLAEETEGGWLLTISHDGVGVAPEMRESIINVLQPGRDRRDISADGSAQMTAHIGLAVCKKVVELHQGRLWFEPGKGDSFAFRFTLPRRG